MADLSQIEWTENTGNPVTGCSRVSEGCRRCHAERIACRLLPIGSGEYREGLAVALHQSTLQEPLRWLKPRLVFVNSMSDLFHESVPSAFIESVFSVMNDSPRHTFQVLTKRAQRVSQLTHRLNWTPNIWLGVSIESERWLERLEVLRRTVARTKFLSLEPLLGPLSGIELAGVDWVIVGGESGPGARPVQAGWVRELRDKCPQSHVPFFFKQWGGVHKKRTGRLLDGRTWDQMPALRSAPPLPEAL